MRVDPAHTQRWRAAVDPELARWIEVIDGGRDCLGDIPLLSPVEGGWAKPNTEVTGAIRVTIVRRSEKNGTRIRAPSSLEAFALRRRDRSRCVGGVGLVVAGRLCRVGFRARIP